MLVTALIDVMRDRLFDPAPGTGWSNDELIRYLNEGVNATCLIKPDAYTKQEFIPMAPGVTQQLPADGIALFDLTENQASGRRITQVDRALLDEENRFWPAATPEVDVQHYATDPNAPRRFYVTPPNTGTGMVKCLYGAMPAAMAGLSDELPLIDIYQPALLAYALSRAYMKASKRRDAQASSSAFNEWATMVGAKTQAQRETAPRVAQTKGVA